LESVSFPNLGGISDKLFSNCTSLKSVSAPLVTSIVSLPFEGTKVTMLDSHRLTYCNGASFNGFTTLETVIIRTDTICTAGGKPFANQPNVYIYVPRALLSDDDATKDYRRATNWSAHASQFRALEDYTVDGTTTGELDETKI
jgi:hypothetical protein